MKKSTKTTVENFEIREEEIGKFSVTPNYTEFKTSKRYNRKNENKFPKKLSGNEYVDLETGEIKKYMVNEKKTEEAFKRNFRKIPIMIKGNFDGGENERYLIFRYNKPVSDTEILSRNFKYFLVKLKKSYPTIVYLYSKECDVKGVWSIHCILKILDRDKFNLECEVLKNLWKRGDVEMQRIHDIQKFAWKFNILRYSDGLMRLHYYPSKFHPFGYSENLRIEEHIDKYGNKDKYTDNKDMCFRKQYLINDKYSGNLLDVIKYEQYMNFNK